MSCREDLECSHGMFCLSKCIKYFGIPGGEETPLPIRGLNMMCRSGLADMNGHCVADGRDSQMETLLRKCEEDVDCLNGPTGLGKCECGMNSRG